VNETDKYAAQIKAEVAEDHARLEQAHRLLAESEDHWLLSLAGVMEWLITLYDEWESSEAKVEAQQRLVADLRSLAELYDDSESSLRPSRARRKVGQKLVIITARGATDGQRSRDNAGAD
jgi:hypothetical protein